jgi:hypothetical protein
VALCLELVVRYRPGHRPNIGRAVSAVQDLFTRNGVNITLVVGEDAALNTTAMESVNVGSCLTVLDEKHRGLFQSVMPISSPNQAVVFVVRAISTGGTFSGCAAHLPGCPGLVITEAAMNGSGTGSAGSGGWVLAHEIAHVLGLRHVGLSGSLMFDPATAIASVSPALSADECRTLERSSKLGPGTSQRSGPARRNGPLDAVGATGGGNSRPTPTRVTPERDTVGFPERRRRTPVSWLP